MKKSLSLLLSVLLVISSFISLLTVTTVSAGEIPKGIDENNPKLISTNLLNYAASYESFDVGTQLKYTGSDYPTGKYFGGNKNAGYLGQTKQEIIYDNKGNAIQQKNGGRASSNGVSAVVSNTKAHSGEKSLYLENKFWTASMGIDVKPNTDYVLSYYILAPKNVVNSENTIELSAIATTLNSGDSSSVSAANKPMNRASEFYLDSKALTNLHDGENWIKVTHIFNSINLEKVYLLIGQTAYGGGSASWAYIDDMTMIESAPTKLSVEMKSCASLKLIDTDMNQLYVNEELSFKVIHGMTTDPKVAFNNETVIPDQKGVYTVTLGNENNLSIRFDGDESLPWYDEDEQGRKLNENNHEVYSEPIWEGDTVYHETALFTPDKDTVKLLYPVDSVVSLRSYDLTVNYIEGYDYEITANGMIKRLEGGRIPVWANSLVSNTDTGWKRTDGKYVVLTGDTTYPSFAISVTYKHTKTFDDGYTPAAPASQTEKLQKTIKKLKNGEDVNIVIYGDSISCGWSSSGLNPDIKIYDDTNTEGNFKSYNINVAPYAPTWIQMFETELKNRYPNANINIKNLSLGGKSSPWAAQNVEKRLALWKDKNGKQVTPDLMLIGFGVNDSAGNVSVQNFKTNIQNIISTARRVSGNSDMEALMYSPMYPNQDAVLWKATTLLSYEKVMEKIADADENAGLLKLSSIYDEIVKCKAPEDYLNTNLNHGNDFTARVYYTSIMAAMTKDERVKAETEDLVSLSQYVAGWDVDCDSALTDVNKDGKTNLLDVNYLARHLAGWEGYTID